MQKSKRLVALDVLRGLTMACMILVNNPGSWGHIYAPLEHAEWHGWTPTDLIFPFFLFMVGISIKLSLDKYLLAHSRKALIIRIVKRSILIYLIGAFLSGFPQFDLATWRIMGVLQRIAICYLFASLLYISFAKTQEDTVVVPIQPIAIIFLSLLTIYYFIMRFVPVPGIGAGLWDDPNTNIAGYLDNLVLGAHNWSASKTWDPEGLLSTIPALGTAISGILCAAWLTSKKSKTQIFKGLLIGGVIAVILAYLINPLFPINKKLWTSSYVLLSSGLAVLLLGLIYYYTDIKERRFGIKPFLIFGSNAITVYFLSSFFASLMYLFKIGGMNFKDFIYSNLLAPFLGDTFGSLVFALLYVLFWLAVMSVFYKKKIFIKI